MLIRNFYKSNYTLTGCCRRLKLKFVDKTVIIRGACRRCGRCCRKLCLDINGRWVSSANRFRKLVRDNPDYGRFHITGRNPFGCLEFVCDRLQPDGSCGDHDHRPDICRKYPERELYFTGGVLPPWCGYYFEEVPDFEKLIRTAGSDR